MKQFTIIYGPQGSGKTAKAKELTANFKHIATQSRKFLSMGVDIVSDTDCILLDTVPMEYLSHVVKTLSQLKTIPCVICVTGEITERHRVNLRAIAGEDNITFLRSLKESSFMFKPGLIPEMMQKLRTFESAPQPTVIAVAETGTGDENNILNAITYLSKAGRKPGSSEELSRAIEYIAMEMNRRKK